MLYAIVVYKTETNEIGGDFPYDGIRSWQIRGDWLVLTRSRHEHILVPADAVTSVEIRVDKDYEEADNDR